VLDGWAGTLLVVSHDRYLLERMTDRQVAMLGDGDLRDLPGGVEQYLQLRRELQAGATRRSSNGRGRAGRAAGDGPRGGGSGGDGSCSRGLPGAARTAEVAPAGQPVTGQLATGKVSTGPVVA